MHTPLFHETQLRQLLRAGRKRARITQAEMAESLGISQARVSQIENAPLGMSVELLLRWLQCVGLELGYQPAPSSHPATLGEAERMPAVHTAFPPGIPAAVINAKHPEQPQDVTEMHTRDSRTHGTHLSPTAHATDTALETLKQQLAELQTRNGEPAADSGRGGHTNEQHRPQ